SERQRMAFVQVLLEDYQRVLTLTSGGSAEAVRKALDLVLRRKAVWVEALAQQRTAVQERRYPARAEQLQRVLALRRQLAFKMMVGPGPEGLATHQRILGDWSQEVGRLMRDLSHDIPEVDLQRRLRKASCEAVAQALPTDAALVEFVCYRPFDFARG